jgi:hypothetical protein
MTRLLRSTGAYQNGTPSTSRSPQHRRFLDLYMAALDAARMPSDPAFRVRGSSLARR